MTSDKFKRAEETDRSGGDAIVAPPRRRFAAGFRLFFCAFFIITIALLLFFYSFVGDTTPLGEYVTIWPPFLWLFGLIPLAMLAADRRRPRTIVAAVAALFFFVLATTEWGSLVRFGTPQASPGKDPMRLIVWNISGGSGGRQVYLSRAAALNADVCFFSESPDGIDEIEEFDEAGLFPGFYYEDAGDCALLSRYPIREVASSRVGPWMPPQVLLCDGPSSKSLMLINVRLMLPSLVLNPLSRKGRERLERDHGMRMEQNRNLAALIEQLQSEHQPGGTILAGDFNTPGGARSLAPLRKPLRDVWPLAGRGWGATMTNSFPVARIDQCWVSPEITPIQAWVENGAPSDHRLLVVDLEF